MRYIAFSVVLARDLRQKPTRIFETTSMPRPGNGSRCFFLGGKNLGGVEENPSGAMKKTPDVV